MIWSLIIKPNDVIYFLLNFVMFTLIFPLAAHVHAKTWNSRGSITSITRHSILFWTIPWKVPGFVTTKALSLGGPS